MPPLIFPQASTADALARLLDQALTLRLYANNHTPQVTDTIADYIEVVGGGYASAALDLALWTITPGSPSVALYSAYVDFIFTAIPPIPTVYGYYVTNADDLVVWAEEFDPGDAPFIVTGLAIPIQIRPRIGSDNLVAAPPEIV